MSLFQDTKDPAESIVVEFDFSSEMTAVSSAVVSIAIHGSGVDPAVASMLDGAPQISGTSVFQRVQLGVDGVNYCPKCVGINGSDKIVRARVLAVRNAC